jgi:two-component system phosphate regulon sensor histidine kinase PhoR
MNFSRTIRVHGIRFIMGVTTALAVAWFCEPYVGPSWGLRAVLIGSTLTVIALLFRWEMSQQSASGRTAIRYLELLCRLEQNELSDPEVLASLPKIVEGKGEGIVLVRVRDRLVDYCRRADEAEHSWKSCEVRLRRIENEHRQLMGILDRVADPILTCNHYDELTWTNQAARELFGLVVPDDGERKLEQLLSCKPLVDALTEARRRKNNSSRSTELEITDAAGHPRWYRLTTRSLVSAQGDDPSTPGALAVLTDISVEKGIQKRHAEFVSSAAHELKTPLASIRAYVELLQDKEAEDPATQEEFLDVIATQADRLQRLILNLLNLARIEAGVVKVEKQNLTLNEVLEQAFAVVQPTAEEKKLELINDLSPMHLGVFVDRDMTLQAAINLLSNAVKYTPVPGKVTLRSRMDDNAATFEVEDTGVGLSSEDCEKVFERFYRVKKDQQMAPGTGLGLALVKHIVEEIHGGTVTVASQLGKGSTFRVTLPAVNRSRA